MEQQIATMVLWVDASTDLEFLESHNYITKRLHGELDQDSTSEEQLKQFYNRLDSKPGTKLVVWDNVDDVDDSINFFMSLPTTSKTHILITSRKKHLEPAFAKDAVCFEVSDFSLLESLTLFGRMLGGDADRTDLIDIADQMGNLPLAIVHAGAYMQQRQLSPTQYKIRYEQAQTNVVNSIGSLRGLSATFELSFASLDASSTEVLAFISVLGKAQIPRYLLLNRNIRDVVHHWVENLDASLRLLGQFSLIHLTHDEANLSIHRLVQSMFRNRLRPQGLENWQIV